jgi:hypothetical protein
MTLFSYKRPGSPKANRAFWTEWRTLTGQAVLGPREEKKPVRLTRPVPMRRRSAEMPEDGGLGPPCEATSRGCCPGKSHDRTGHLQCENCFERHTEPHPGIEGKMTARSLARSPRRPSAVDHRDRSSLRRGVAHSHDAGAPVVSASQGEPLQESTFSKECSPTCASASDEHVGRPKGKMDGDMEPIPATSAPFGDLGGRV